MKDRSEFFRGRLSGLCGLALIVTAACTPARDFGTSVAPTFSQVQATEVFAAGYGGISEKYIEAVSVEDIAIEGLRGLGAIDPNLTITRVTVETDAATPTSTAKDHAKNTKAVVILHAEGEEIIRLDAPAPDDVNGWAALTTKLSLSARKASSEMHAAPIEAVYEAVFDGVLSNLDIFSRYAGAELARRNRSKRDGFGGIGIRYRATDGLPVLSDVLPKTPAARGGLRKGDKLTHIDGVSLRGLDRKIISRKLRGPTRTLVELTFFRPGEGVSKTVTLKRAHIFPITITEKIHDGVVTLTLSSFNRDTARSLSEKLGKARMKLGDAMKGVILDLRGNPGGLLKQSVKVADLLLTQGKIISTRGRHTDSIHHYEAGGRDLAFGLPVVVLVDGRSASAAEIVAAALQDRDRAVIIGTASFGKGSVQTVLRLPNDGEITLTWSRLVAPSGYMFHGLGVRPSICTSGIKGNAQSIIDQTLNNRIKIEDMLAAWRKPDMQNQDQRTQLRNSCPSQRRRDDLELKIARRLIAQPTQFARALDLTAATHQARNPK
ncbi:MAG: PDZ domain-containing protein [Alphaproteobacteria bacterium]|nr:PDZ domain-containing protein [Alphaproteobacteria bacterium]MBT7943585.1 PDZ domain-containing protein [Alphaproteobacteria bacterium]